MHIIIGQYNGEHQAELQGMFLKYVTYY